MGGFGLVRGYRVNIAIKMIGICKIKFHWKISKQNRKASGSITAFNAHCHMILSWSGLDVPFNVILYLLIYCTSTGGIFLFIILFYLHQIFSVQDWNKTCPARCPKWCGSIVSDSDIHTFYFKVRHLHSSHWDMDLLTEQAPC